jgi:ketosteroid isomerase-like protein
MRIWPTPDSQRPTSNKGPTLLGVATWKLGICAMLVVGATATSLAQRPVQSAQQILEQLERDWIEALQTNNVAFIDSVLAPEFVATYGDGSRADKKRELQMVKDFNQQVDEWIVDEFIIKVFGNTAVVWFTQRMTGPVQGKPTQIVSRYMDVFVNRDGKWLCVGSQSTRVK